MAITALRPYGTPGRGGRTFTAKEEYVPVIPTRPRLWGTPERTLRFSNDPEKTLRFTYDPEKTR